MKQRCFNPNNPKFHNHGGRLIALERSEFSDQMMRVAERIGIYDKTKLDMQNPEVFDHIDEFLEARAE